MDAGQSDHARTCEQAARPVANRQHRRIAAPTALRKGNRASNAPARKKSTQGVQAAGARTKVEDAVQEPARKVRLRHMSIPPPPRSDDSTGDHCRNPGRIRLPNAPPGVILLLRPEQTYSRHRYESTSLERNLVSAHFVAVSTTAGGSQRPLTIFYRVCGPNVNAKPQVHPPRRNKCAAGMIFEPLTV